MVEVYHKEIKTNQEQMTPEMKAMREAWLGKMEANQKLETKTEAYPERMEAN
jgi:hypothetical protein